MHVRKDDDVIEDERSRGCTMCMCNVQQVVQSAKHVSFGHFIVPRGAWELVGFNPLFAGVYVCAVSD
jgi:hypothetical protein